MTKSPAYAQVPKGFDENLEFRSNILAAAHDNRELQRSLWCMCARDMLFWINTFCYIFEPRDSREYPYITYEYQDEAMLTVQRYIGRKDIGIDKSRDMGASWNLLTVIKHDYIFGSLGTYMVMSRNERLVDGADDPDTLLWKFDFLEKYLPYWMKPPTEAADLKRRNPLNGCTVHGSSTTGDAGRGGRKKAFVCDEFAAFGLDAAYSVLSATQANTNCRIFNSTPKGGSGAFFDVMHDESMEIERIRMHWSRHPKKNRGLYQSKNGVLEIIDKKFKFPANYKHILDGKLRSPWYDRECRRTPVPEIIAQDLDIDYLGSDYPFFPVSLIQLVEQECVVAPYRTGHLHIDEGCYPINFDESDGGRLKLWCILDDITGEPPQDRAYVIGCDISMGTGASNSAAVVYDRMTAEKCAEIATAHMEPQEFARFCIALARWFGGMTTEVGGAFMVWEANGPGRLFGKEVIRRGYRNIYYKTVNDKPIVPKRTDLIPGWYSTAEAKKLIFGEYKRGLVERKITNRSAASIKEHRQYVTMKTGEIEHRGAVSSLNPNDARENHGDIVVADALAFMVIDEQPAARKAAEKRYEEGSFGYRREQRALQRAEADDWT